MANRYSNPMKVFQELGVTVKKLRLKNGWTQEDMMDHGFSLRFYQRIEAGKSIHMRTVIKLANAFNVTLKQLLSKF